METRPVQSVGILWGEGTSPSHHYHVRDLCHSFSGPETRMIWQVGDSITAPDPDDVKELFREIAHPAAGRGLIVMVLNGHAVSGNRRLRQPLRTAPYASPSQYLAGLQSVLRVRGQQHPPVDVFMLVAQRTNVRAFATYFPANSTLIALRTPSKKPATAWFDFLAHHKNASTPWPVAPGAKELLLDYMLSGGDFIPARKAGNFRWPAIAVRDHHPSPDMNDVWNELTLLKPINTHADQLTRERLLTMQDVRGYSDFTIERAIDALGRRLAPSRPADYAGALLAGRHRLFGLEASWQWLDDQLIANAYSISQNGQLDFDLSEAEADPEQAGLGELTGAEKQRRRRARGVITPLPLFRQPQAFVRAFLPVRSQLCRMPHSSVWRRPRPASCDACLADYFLPAFAFSAAALARRLACAVLGGSGAA